MANKLSKQFNKSIFKHVNKTLIYLYNSLENILAATTTNKAKNHIYLHSELKKMNKVVNRFYKRPELQIFATDNLIPFRFETEDGVVIDGLKHITDPQSDKWIVSCHWFAGNKYCALYSAKPFIDLGYNVLVFDFRNHGKSQKNQPVSLGILEVQDLMAALKWLNQNHKYKHLGLMGISMGAYTMNYAIAKYPELMKKYKVKFAISDVTYGSIKTLLLHVRNSKARRLISARAIAKKINEILLDQEEATKLNWNESDIFSFYEKQNRPGVVPTFFSHGMNDKVTSPVDTMRLFIGRQKQGAKDDILIYNFSAHALSIRDHFHSLVHHWLAFENKIVGDDEATARALKTLKIDPATIHQNKEELQEVSTFDFQNHHQKGGSKNAKSN